MAALVSLAKHHPHLEGVFGPLTPKDDRALRATFAEIDEELLALASHLGQRGAGGQGTGLELVWKQSGQLSIASCVGATRNSIAADFCVELRPAWFYGPPTTGDAGWDVEATIQVDCQHSPDHGGMDLVWERGDIRRRTPAEAAAELLGAAGELRRQGTDYPLEHWQSLTRDD